MAGISVFSGRPNPSWPLSHADFEDLLRIWDSLDPTPVATKPNSFLGYRGCFVEDGEERWTASDDIVTIQRPHGTESRRDVRREFERRILSTAPVGLHVAALTGFDRR
jgi:hypothetical protein